MASPRPVSPGSRLAVVAPAGPFDPEAFRRGVAWLRERYQITHDDGIFSRTGYFAGDDERRLAELLAAIEDDAVDAILCARGGFGATRLLPGLDTESIRGANKRIVGYSDISALHAAWARAGVPSLHAPMVASLGNASETVRRRWIEALEHPEAPSERELARLDRTGTDSAEGRLIGGNLAVLGALNGTPYAPPLDGALLFIEDVGERPYRVDRMLTTLHQSGWFERLRGVVIGAFTQGDPGSDGVSLDDVFARHFGEAAFPVLTGLSAGHVDDNEPLPFGGPARIAGNRLLLGDAASGLT